MKANIDRLYNLLPEVYRRRDTEEGFPLKALLRVIAEQVQIAEEDIARLYENWFIETCQDWVVSYIGDLVGYQTVYTAGEAQTGTPMQQAQRNRILLPRRDVAHTIRQRRRKGTLALLEELADDVAAWPAHAVEFFQLLVQTRNVKLLDLDQNLHTGRPARGQTLSLRNADALDRLNGPFDEIAHTVDVRRVNSHRTGGRYTIPNVGLFVWRLKTYPVTKTPADNAQEAGRRFFTFSILGNDSHLYTNPLASVPETASEELRFPTPIRQRAFLEHTGDYYGAGKSLQIWISTTRHSAGAQQTGISRQPDPSLVPVPPQQIITADLGNWQQYRLGPQQIAVDPVCGRIAFPGDHLPVDVWVSYYYAFSADIGGGEYNRPLSAPADAALYRVGGLEESKSLAAALELWRKADPKPPHVVIEITDSGVYTEVLNISLEENERLQIRAANYTRPVIRQENWEPDRSESVNVTGKAGSRFILDGVLIAGRGVKIQGDLAAVTIRHCTLVPGWSITEENQPRWTNVARSLPSLELFHSSASVSIEHSVIGSIEIDQDYQDSGGEPAQDSRSMTLEPLHMNISDSIVDAANPALRALSTPDTESTAIAPVWLTVVRSTIFGKLLVHALELAENSIFAGQITVARRQVGCMRFCSLTLPARTPSRYNCQPDLVMQAVDGDDSLSAEEQDAAREREHNRVLPLFNSTHYGMPTYCQLAHTCAEEIKGGADDESEMGVFHDLYQPQRAANLRARLDEYTPTGSDAGIIYVN